MVGLPPLTLEETLQAVAIPPIERNLGARVEHIYVSQPGLLSQAVESALELPHSFVLELIRFGAVHWCPVMPQPSPKAAPRMSQQHLDRMQALRAEGIARHGKSPKLQFPRRAAADCTIEEGAYIRVHVHPKRFPAAYSVDWRQRVLADRPEYVVVDKPAGVQVPPTVDNMLENVGVLTAAALGLPPDALLNTHRLDAGTSGVVVLAKSSAFAAWFTSLLANKPGFVVKTYRCLTAVPPPVGPMVHWAVVKQREKGEPAHTRILLECAVPDVHSSSSGAAGGEDGGAAAQAGVEGAVRCELIVQAVRADRHVLLSDSLAHAQPLGKEGRRQEPRSSASAPHRTSCTGLLASCVGCAGCTLLRLFAFHRQPRLPLLQAACCVGTHAPHNGCGVSLVSLQVQQVCLTGRAAREWGPHAHETTLQLVTGRTHQIRAQMAAVGCPLLGDQLYTALAALWQQEREQPQQPQQPHAQEQQQQQQQLLQHDAEGRQQQQPPCQQQQEPQQQQDGAHSGRDAEPPPSAPQHRHAGSKWSQVYQEDPSRPIGLQAAKLQVRDIGGRMSCSAAPPASEGDGSTSAAEEVQGADQADDQEPGWVAFEAGVPWWRA